MLSFTHKKVSRGNNTDSLWGNGLQLVNEEEPEEYQAHFSGTLKEGLEADDLAEMYASVHAAIRADPSAQLTEKNAPTEKKTWVAVSWYSFTKSWLHLVPYLYTLVVFCFWGLSAGQVHKLDSSAFGVALRNISGYKLSVMYSYLPAWKEQSWTNWELIVIWWNSWKMKLSYEEQKAALISLNEEGDE